MSQQLIDRSPDLKRLRDEGYDVEIRSPYLLIKNVPYVKSDCSVAFGTLITELSVAGDVTTKPGTHIVYFAGAFPCHRDGSEIAQLKHESHERTLDTGLVIQHSFSNKPPEGYSDHYKKMATYVHILSSPACSLNDSVTATPFPTIEATQEESVFNYIDTASSRSQIAAVTRKLEGGKIGIIGLGGTGSYVLDQIAKTPVREIHLFDGDKFSQHNAFRSPGAPSVEELRAEPQKVVYFKEKYAKMHRFIFDHDIYIDKKTVDELDGLDFVFLCIDRGDVKELIIKELEGYGIPFIDVGMGIELVDNYLIGILRVTASTSEKREHVRGKKRISFDNGDDGDYARNIQIADLNSLNATMAVIKWKKLKGFYQDLEKEHHSTYTLNVNMLTSEDYV